MIKTSMMALLQLGKIAAIAAAAGVGPLALLAPPRWRHGWLVLPLLLNCGLGLVAIVGVEAIYSEHAVGSAVPWAIGLSGACLATAMLWKWKNLPAATRGLWHDFRKKGAGSVLLFSVALLAVWPGIRTGGEQPYRVGVDEIGYAVTAQYLRDGGTRHALATAIQHETGQPTVAQALLATSTALDFNLNISAEFILKSQRSGYPGLVASVLQAIGVERVVLAQWLLLFFPLWLLAAVMAVFLCEDLGLSQPVGLLWAAALGLNCNLLNVLCEGQHAQVFTSGLTAILIVLWWRWRRMAASGASLRAIFGRDFILGVFVFAVVAATYSEQLILLGGAGVLMCVADLVVERGRINRGNWAVVLACLTGLLATGRYATEWVPFVIRHVTNVASGGGGFWQPQWALPLDILGYTNIYAIAVPDFIGRGWWVALPLGLASLALLEFTLWKLWRERTRDPAFWLAPMLFVAAIFAKSFFWDHIHNYNYMKAYTLLLLPLLALHAWTFTELCQMTAVRWPTHRWARGLGRGPLLLPAWIILTGLVYLGGYEHDAITMPAGVRALASQESRRILQDAGIVIGGSGGIGNQMLGAYARLPWLNLAWADPFLPPHDGKRILFLALKRDLVDPESIARRHAGSIVLENSDVLLIDTGERIRVPPEQIGRQGLKPTDLRNPAKPRWPVTLYVEWSKLADKIME